MCARQGPSARARVWGRAFGWWPLDGPPNVPGRSACTDGPIPWLRRLRDRERANRIAVAGQRGQPPSHCAAPFGVGPAPSTHAKPMRRSGSARTASTSVPCMVSLLLPRRVRRLLWTGKGGETAGLGPQASEQVVAGPVTGPANVLATMKPAVTPRLAATTAQTIRHTALVLSRTAAAGVWTADART